VQVWELRLDDCRSIRAFYWRPHALFLLLLPSVGNDFGVDVIGDHLDNGEGRPFDLVGL